MTLKAVDPIDITDAVLTASDIPEPDIANGEFEWEDEATRFLEITENMPTGYNFSVGINYVSGYGYFTAVRNSSDPNLWAIARYDESFNFQSVTPVSVSFGDSPRVVGFSYSQNTGLFTMFWRQHAGSWLFYYQKYDVDLNLSLSETNIANMTNDILTSNPGLTPISMCQSGDFIYCSVNLPTGEPFVGGDFLYKLNPDGSSVSSVQSSFSGQVANDQSGGFFLVGSTEKTIYAYNYSSSLSLLSSNALKSYQTTTGKWRIGFSGGILALVEEAGDGSTLTLTPFSETFTNLGSYKKGDEVIVSSVHRKYRCLVSETFDYPVDGATEDASATWIDIGPTNKWAMFDEKTTTSTIDGTSFSMTFNPVNYVNAMAFFNVAGTESINITVKDAGGTERYNEDFALIDISPIYDYYTYFFYQNTSNDELVADDLPPYYDPEITVTFTGNTISVGAMVMGFANQIGTALTDTQTDTLDYSRQEYDVFGELTYIERPVVKLNTYEVLADKTINPYIQNLIKKLIGKNTLWIGDIGGGQKLITYGRYERSPIPFTMPNDVRYSITVRGSI
jgi:hypothetical protein